MKATFTFIRATLTSAFFTVMVLIFTEKLNVLINMQYDTPIIQSEHKLVMEDDAISLRFSDKSLGLSTTKRERLIADSRNNALGGMSYVNEPKIEMSSKQSIDKVNSVIRQPKYDIERSEKLAPTTTSVHSDYSSKKVKSGSAFIEKPRTPKSLEHNINEQQNIRPTQHEIEPNTMLGLTEMHKKVSQKTLSAEGITIRKSADLQDTNHIICDVATRLRYGLLDNSSSTTEDLAWCKRARQNYRVFIGRSWGTMGKDERFYWDKVKCNELLAAGQLQTCSQRFGWHFLSEWLQNNRTIVHGISTVTCAMNLKTSTLCEV